MQKSVHLCLAALFALTAVVIVESLGVQCCPRGRGNFSNRDYQYKINEPVYSSTGIVFCSSNNRCNEITTCKISSTYGDLFAKSPPEYMYRQSCRIQNTDYVTRSPVDRKKRESDNCGPSDDPSDGDACCETEIYPTQYHGWYVSAANGGNVYVICLLGTNGKCVQYQFVSEGRCGTNSICAYTDQPCTQEYTVHTLLAYKPGSSFPYISFEPIMVPSHCSCKRG